MENLLSRHGWSQMPLLLKLPPPAVLPIAKRSGKQHLVAVGDMLRSLLRLPQTAVAQPPTEAVGALRTVAPLALAGGSGSLVLAEAPVKKPELPVSQSEHRGNDGPLTLNAYMLGSFQVMIGGTPVTNWSSGRGRVIFQYLLAQRGRPIPRDVMMDIFWPEAEPDAARNNLNVAMHGLRQTLKAVTEQPIVQFEENCYRLSSRLVVWMDVAEFERSVVVGREREAAGQPAQAAKAYESALNLYQGDMLEDAPYEEWPALERERLRVLFLDTLDRLSGIHFNAGAYTDCITVCQKLLARDMCREDAHCRLMRCYSRQGQSHLALRQYQICVDALRDELNVSPAPATIHLYQQIRRRETV